MPLFQRYHKEDLLVGGDGKRNIEKLTSVSLSERLDYAWKVLNSAEKKYTPLHKEGAQQFLCQAFGLPESNSRVLIHLQRLMELKTDTFIPKFADLRTADVRPPRETPRAVEAPVSSPPRAVPPLTPPMGQIALLREETTRDARVNRFLRDVNKDIQQLNRLIDDFNRSTIKNEKIGHLLKIHEYRKQILNTYSEREINYSVDFQQKIQTDLFTEIKKQAGLLGVASIDKKTPELAAASTAPKTLPEIIENMAQGKAEQLISMLAAGERLNIRKLQSLYQPHEEGYREYKTFLENNSITYLGGGNSKNFKITPNDGSTPYVLKVEYRMGVPKSAEVYLREHALRNILTEDKADRLVTFRDSATHQVATRRLVVTEFCTGGDLESHGSKISDHQARLQSALNIYTQMGTILNGIKNDGFGFPDMKNTNWLIDERGVRLADSKSFMYANPRGQIDTKSEANRYFGFISTGYMNPPEFSRAATHPIDIDKMHSFMMGKNLYQYVTGCPWSELHGKSSAADYNFNHPVFKDDVGQRLKATITRMIQPEPSARISVDRALQELELAKAMPQIVECRSLLKQLQATKLGNNDEKIDDYIAKKERELANLTNARDIPAIKQELNTTLAHLHQNQATIGILKDITANLKGSWGGAAKIERIEKALGAIPLEQRMHLDIPDTPEKLNLHKALASHRYFWRAEPKIEDGKVHEATAANSFVRFKEAMHKNKVEAVRAPVDEVTAPHPEVK
ncbi:serine/threonine protein kinase [Legionella adelaidensis]|uniref:histidine kinase n=1 Tax=Legionella adelaidensis TaxID=45056 RepID=A0A0W0R6J7_9GAMM|nr:hypothetical protein [Legionella adelaidensis]KTC66645.1 serine/threonine protein kinase [Legionella adelaidensis]